MSSSSSSSSSRNRSKTIERTRQWTTYKDNKNFRRQLNKAEKNQPIYSDPFAEARAKAVDALRNSKFEFDAANNKVYQDYSKDYELLGDISTGASADQTEALSGGYGTTYGETVAQQANDSYLSNKKTIIPSLYQQEYNNYQQDVSNKVNEGNLINTLEAQKFSEYADSLNRFNDKRDYAYNRYWNDRMAHGTTHEKGKTTEKSSTSETSSTTTVTPNSSGGRGRRGGRRSNNTNNTKKSRKNNLMSIQQFQNENAKRRWNSYAGALLDKNDPSYDAEANKQLKADYQDYVNTYIRQTKGSKEDNWFKKKGKEINKARREFYGY